MKKTFCTAVNLPDGTDLELYFGLERIQVIPPSVAARTLGVWWAADLSVHGSNSAPGQFDIVAGLIGEADQSRRGAARPDLEGARYLWNSVSMKPLLIQQQPSPCAKPTERTLIAWRGPSLSMQQASPPRRPTPS